MSQPLAAAAASVQQHRARYLLLLVMMTRPCGAAQPANECRTTLAISLVALSQAPNLLVLVCEGGIENTYYPIAGDRQPNLINGKQQRIHARAR